MTDHPPGDTPLSRHILPTAGTLLGVCATLIGLVKVIEPEEFIKKTGYTSPHTIHCGPDGIYGSALGSATGDGPGGQTP